MIQSNLTPQTGTGNLNAKITVAACPPTLISQPNTTKSSGSTIVFTTDVYKAGYPISINNIS